MRVISSRGFSWFPTFGPALCCQHFLCFILRNRSIQMTVVHVSIDCKTVGFFLKINKEIGKAWRKSLTRAKRASLTRPLSVFSLIPDILFDCSRVLEYAKIRTVLQSNVSKACLACARLSDSIVGTYFRVFKYARVVKQKVWNTTENRERDLGRDAKNTDCPFCIFFSLASHPLRACEARALRARKTLAALFTDFFTYFEKKNPDCFVV